MGFPIFIDALRMGLSVLNLNRSKILILLSMMNFNHDKCIRRDPDGVLLNADSFLFVVDEGERIQMPLNASNLVDVDPILNAGLVDLFTFQRIRTSIAKKPCIFVIFSGWGVWTPCPHL